ncbi:hypothetical protein CcaCcLH18_03279 [Colletotrichum camelliae]|nr:hypothetical protein CcaCcLH18_03279 [Colletotrichum camelliae]
MGLRAGTRPNHVPSPLHVNRQIASGMADPPFTSLCQFASAHGNKLYRQVPTHSPVCEQRLGIATPTLRQPSAKSGAAQARDRGQDGKEGKADWGASADGGGRWRDTDRETEPALVHGMRCAALR